MASYYREASLGTGVTWWWKQRAADAHPTVLDELVDFSNLDASETTSDSKEANAGPGSDGTGNWRPSVRWRKARKGVPSEVHVELLEAGLIPDPFVGFNEHKVQWIGEAEWLYACALSMAKYTQWETSELVFEGLDTICDVYIDGRLVLEADNQFRTYTVRLEAASLGSEDAERTRQLLLHFKSAKQVALEREAQYGRMRAGSFNLGDSSRVYVRKAQYDWRWDWGPELMTCGPYRPILLRTYTACIADLYPRTTVSTSSSSGTTANVSICTLGVRVAVADNLDAVETMRVTLLRASNSEDEDTAADVAIREVQLAGMDLKNAMWSRSRKDDGTQSEDEETVEIVKWVFEPGEVELWWPVGYGAQTLYAVSVALFNKNGELLDRRTTRFGFRRVELVQVPLTETDQYGKGTTFYFTVNGVRMFMGGSNWVPADSFLTRITPERMLAWLQLARDGNQNMVRVWGGGVYEPDMFYDMCDELGLLVWQDFMFACGVYPAHDAFVESVRAEAVDNVRRLRRHPCLALFCGNNEDYQQILQWNLEPELPARKLYEHVLPGIVRGLTHDDVPYHPGSPYGGPSWYETTDPSRGDVHQWNVWAGTSRYHDYDILGGRFVSEFGMPAVPDLRTVEHAWLETGAGAGGEDRDKEMRRGTASWSRAMAQHCRAGNHARRFAWNLAENFKDTGEFETYSYNTQLLQSDALGFAYRAWRRQWKGPGKEFTGGALVWQLNDCWPATSWAIVDYFLRPKPAYYTIARELRTHTVGIFREVKKSRESDLPRQFYDFSTFPCVGARIAVWATNATLQPCTVALDIILYDVASNWTHIIEPKQVVLAPNAATELLEMDMPEPPTPLLSSDDSLHDVDEEELAFSREMTTWDPPRTLTHRVIVAARLRNVQTGEVLARTVDWPQPYRLYVPRDPGLSVSIERASGSAEGVSGHGGSNGEDRVKVVVRARRPARGVVLNVHGDADAEVRWSDNMLDVMPGDVQEVEVRGLAGRAIYAAYLGSEKASEVMVE